MGDELEMGRWREGRFEEGRNKFNPKFEIEDLVPGI